MIRYSPCLLIFMIISSQTGLIAQKPRVPLNMWLPGVMPAGLSKLSPTQASVHNRHDRVGKPLVMQDLSLSPGHLDMDDEFSVPYALNLAVRDPELNEFYPTDEKEEQKRDEDMSQSDEARDRIIASKPLYSSTPRLLSGYNYGTSAGLAVFPISYKTYQAPAVVPLAVPVVQPSLTPFVQMPQVSHTHSVPAVQPTLTHSQQTITINAQLPQQQQQQQQNQQPQQQQQQQPTSGQGRMIIPQSIQPQGVIQPQQVVQPVVPPQQVFQPSETLPGQGRFQWPTSVNTPSQTVLQQPAQQVQTMQQQQQQQQQQHVSRKITITHKTLPQNIHIVLPKTHGYYGYRKY
ncbi:unnamed protein product [Echinostoma caproni]|uniref:Transcription factor SPT20 homolog n=1 Tax=Echinostoma caproni TaxID=27848 RepID=A0A183AV80_9TREM|nr:unnamed protein product [Echinostoma caproni]